MNNKPYRYILCLLLFILAGNLSAQEQKYTCPMHPHYIATEMGACPYCGMDLVPLETEDNSTASNSASATPPENSASKNTSQNGEQKYTCPMHPHYIATEMGACPYCGMDLVPLETTQDSESMQDGKSDAKDGMAPTRASVTIDAHTIQKMGVRTQPVRFATFGQNIRSYGSVTENKRLMQTLTTRVAGWIEKLNITAVGDSVKKGDVLYHLYSPELLSAQQDYIAALSSGHSARIRASAARLTAFGVDEAILAQIRSNRKALQQVPFMAKRDGIISELDVADGDYVKAGARIARLQNYSSVWVMVNVAEQDMQYINTNSDVTVTFPNLGDYQQQATIDYIEPTIDRSSRTGQVRLLLDNAQGMLRPGAYADVKFEVNPKEHLSVPSESILMTINGDYIVKALGDGTFQPVAVNTGIDDGVRTEIIEGLEDGDEIVVSGQFLLDSESSLRASFTQLQNSQKPLAQLDVSRNQLAMIDHYTDAALYLHDMLVQDKPTVPAFFNPALTLKEQLMPAFRQTRMQFVLEDAHLAVEQAKDARTKQARQAALAALTEALMPWIQTGNPAHYIDKNVRLFIDHGTGQHWIQIGDDMQHPYGDGHAIPVEIDKHDADMTDNNMSNNMDMRDTAANMGGAHAHH